jgi:hypothetical protein
MFQQFFQDLFAGDPVALIILGVLAAVALVIGLVWLKISRDLRREDEENKRKRQGRGPKKG